MFFVSCILVRSCMTTFLPSRAPSSSNRLVGVIRAGNSVLSFFFIQASTGLQTPSILHFAMFISMAETARSAVCSIRFLPMTSSLVYPSFLA